jgi:type VI secretion system secreted protein VgrG
MTSGSQGAGALSLSMSCQDITHVTTLEYVAGEEGISTPYSYDVTFTTNGALTASNLIGKSITISINTAGNGQLLVHGVIFAVFCGDPLANGNFLYRVTLRPRLSLLGLNERNQVFGTLSAMSVTDLIDKLLSGTLDTQSSITNASQPNIDHDTSQLTSGYPTSDFIVQYGESDLNFLSRRCEAAGICYFFKQGDGASTESLIFADKNVTFATCSFEDGSSTIDYSNSQPIALVTNPTVSSFCAVSQALPASVYLLDYNYTAATTNLLTSKAQVSSNGVGNVIEYGDNYANVNDGDTLATVRAQAIACQGAIYRGISNAPQLRPGYIFTLSGHSDTNLNIKYVVTKAKHSAGTPVGFGQDSGAAPQAYTVEFEAIPYDTTYRPQRVTPKPVIAGLVNAVVDSSGDGQRADIDSSGGYQLRLLYDLSTSGPGKASNSIRKAGPYAGKSDSGLDFPLLKGTEVILGFINGDPDRPIIVGAAPNSSTTDVVTKNNQTRNRIKTSSGAYLEIEDGAAPASGTQPSNFFRVAALGAAASYFRIGKQADSDATSPGNTTASPPSWGTNLTPMQTTPSVSGYTSSQVADDESGNDGTPVFSSSTNWAAATNGGGAAQQVYGETLNAAPVGSASQYVDGVLVGSQQNLITNVSGAALSLIGNGATTQVTQHDHTTNILNGAFTVNAMKGVHITAGADGNSGDGTTPTNIILEAYGYVKTTSHGNEYVWSKSNSYTLIDADKYQTVKGTYSQLTVGPYIAQYQGTYNSFVAGGRLQCFLGAGCQMSLATDVKIYFPGEIKISLGVDCKMVVGWDFKFVLVGYDMKIVANDIKIVLGTTFENQPNKCSLEVSKLTVGQIWCGMNNLKLSKSDLKAKVEGVVAKQKEVEVQQAEAIVNS